MTDHQLPEDLNSWPRDPHKLLGVAPGVSAKDLRQAYTRLIRRFKPEQFPEHFRRIREAYEHLQHFGRFYGPPPESAPSETLQDDTTAPAQPAVAKNVHDAPAPPAPVAHPPDADALDQLWQLTEGCEAHLAYRRLLECRHRPGNRDDVFLRLYWLLRTIPSADPGQDPCHWLALGLKDNPTGPCQELYYREIERRPAEALGERFDGLLESEAPLSTLALWLQWRWQAAGRLGQWKVIVTNLNALRPRFAGKEDLTWARLLLCALDQLAWCNAPTASATVDQCCRELDELSHVHAGNDLSRVDILLDLAAAWKTLSRDHFPAALIRLIQHSWVRPFFEIRVALLALLENLLSQPWSSLTMLDSLPRVVLGQFGHMVEILRYQPGLFRQPDHPGLGRLMNEFVEDAYYVDYEMFRKEFFGLLLREVAPLDEVLGALEKTSNQDYVGYLHLASEDWPLRILSTAQCCMWG
jgi:hypothetical protein